MMLYALGALELFDHIYDIEEIEMTVYQPRKENISTFTISNSKLLNWVEETVIPKAELAFEREGDFVAGDWCTFCKVAASCRKRAEEKLELAKHEFALPPILSNKEVEEIMPMLDGLTKWADGIIEYATNKSINEGKEWKGYKLVHGSANRIFRDIKEAEKILLKEGHKDIYVMLTLAKLEKKLGKKTFNEILSKEVVKPKGNLKLVQIKNQKTKDKFKEEI